MDFSDSVQQKSTFLMEQARKLSQIEIEWEIPISINCKNLKPGVDFIKENNLDVFSEHKDKPAIYFFEIANDIKQSIIVQALSNYKKQKIRSCPKIDRKRSLDSRYLYCGSIKDGLHGRFIQHMGYGSKDTYALQLCHWASDLDLELNFNYAWLDPKYKDYTELVESALAIKTCPLVGKLA